MTKLLKDELVDALTYARNKSIQTNTRFFCDLSPDALVTTTTIRTYGPILIAYHPREVSYFS